MRNKLYKAFKKGLTIKGYDSMCEKAWDNKQFDSVDDFFAEYPSVDIVGIEIAGNEIRVYD